MFASSARGVEASFAASDILRSAFRWKQCYCHNIGPTSCKYLPGSTKLSNCALAVLCATRLSHRKLSRGCSNWRPLWICFKRKYWYCCRNRWCDCDRRTGLDMQSDNQLRTSTISKRNAILIHNRTHNHNHVQGRDIQREEEVKDRCYM